MTVLLILMLFEGDWFDATDIIRTKSVAWLILTDYQVQANTHFMTVIGYSKRNHLVDIYIDGKLKYILEHNDGRVYAVAISSDKTFVVTCGKLTIQTRYYFLKTARKMDKPFHSTTS
jgi:hypothetical protein